MDVRGFTVQTKFYFVILILISGISASQKNAFEGCSVELLPSDLNITNVPSDCNWITWAKGAPENGILAYDLNADSVYFSEYEKHEFGKYEINTSSLGLTIHNPDSTDGSTYYMTYFDQVFPTDLQITGLNRSDLTKSLEVQYGDQVLTSMATIIVALNSDVTLRISMLEMENNHEPSIVLTKQMKEPTENQTNEDLLVFTGDSHLIKHNTSFASVSEYSVRASICNKSSDTIYVTVVVLDISSPSDLCEFAILNDYKIMEGWLFKEKTILLRLKHLTSSSIPMTLPNVTISTEHGVILKECNNEQGCEFTVQEHLLDKGKENKIYVKTKVNGIDWECTKHLSFYYNGVSARGTLTILGITLAALLVTGLIVTFVVFLIRRYRKRLDTGESSSADRSSNKTTHNNKLSIG